MPHSCISPPSTEHMQEEEDVWLLNTFYKVHVISKHCYKILEQKSCQLLKKKVAINIDIRFIAISPENRSSIF